MIIFVRPTKKGLMQRPEPIPMPGSTHRSPVSGAIKSELNDAISGNVTDYCAAALAHMSTVRSPNFNSR